MSHPFRFGVTTANIRSHTDWITKARKIEELGYSTLLIPDRVSAGLFGITRRSTPPMPKPCVASLRARSLRFWCWRSNRLPVAADAGVNG